MDNIITEYINFNKRVKLLIEVCKNCSKINNYFKINKKTALNFWKKIIKGRKNKNNHKNKKINKCKQKKNK